MKRLKFPLLFLLFAGIFTIAFLGCKKNAIEPGVTSDAKPAPTGKTYYDAVILTCAGATKESISLTVTAGASGAPAGFSIQWMTAAALAANNGVWPSDETQFCKASFSGKAFQSNYNLTAPGGLIPSVTVIVGDFLMDNGASTNCDGDLTCGTDYVFRAFAHGDNAKDRSVWSYQNCSTNACVDCGARHGFGYWKTHGPVPTGNNANEWPSSVLTGGMDLGTVHYDATQILSIMNQSPGGNGLITLAHQLITTKLNVANGSILNGTGITVADNTIGNKVVPPVGNGSLPANTPAGLIPGLHNYNHTCAESVE
ncbi:MAG: hypothetical protein M3Y85_04295 [Bacteroidota bacterium]|nr:hypothetical protein [Bacteroidota bacterium]